MPHFSFEMEDDGRVTAIYKDGVKIEGRVRLEMPNSIVQTYFSGAHRNFLLMKVDQEVLDSRHYGIQAFLMALVGLEAFVNVYFHRSAIALRRPDIIQVVSNKKKTIEAKLSGLPRMTFGHPLPDQKALNRKIREFYNLRTDIVHPKLDPSSLLMGNWASNDMVENYQQMFEDRQFVLEALQWCLLAIARIGIAANDSYGSQFLVFWTTLADTNASLSERLGVSPNPGEL